jgi:lipoate-protein ligase A
MSALVRLLPFAAGDGPSNMAADEVLLASAVDGVASIRYYTWSVATLSLGYFQPARPARAQPELSSLPWVRRPSGGAALVHHHELTYALALPAEPAWQGSAANWICFFHEIVRSVLAGLAIETHLCCQESRHGEVLCFLHHTPGDLLLGSHKIVGSAQRKRRGALLQHGGILLAQSPFTPPLPGISELTGVRIEPSSLQNGLVAEVRRATGWHVEPDDWTEGERRLTKSFVMRYRSSEWNARR